MNLTYLKGLISTGEKIKYRNKYTDKITQEDKRAGLDIQFDYLFM